MMRKKKSITTTSATRESLKLSDSHNNNVMSTNSDFLEVNDSPSQLDGGSDTFPLTSAGKDSSSERWSKKSSSVCGGVGGCSDNSCNDYDKGDEEDSEGDPVGSGSNTASSIPSADSVGSGSRKSSTRMSVRSTNSTRTRSSMAIKPTERERNDLSDLTINKLQFHSLSMHGRDVELEQIKQCWNSVISGTVQRQLILISGYSGTGKSKLAQSLRPMTKQKQGLYVRGKFDLNMRHQPYCGIAIACSEICGSILELKLHNPDKFDRICDRIQKELGGDLCLLLTIIPVLAEIIDITPTETRTLEEQASEATSAVLDGISVDGSTSTRLPNESLASSSLEFRRQFTFAFLRFIRIITHTFQPLVYVLDDLQWADGSSLDLLDVLISDHHTSNLIVIGIYRSNDVDETHIFNRSLDELHKKHQQNDFELTQIEIGNLELDAINEIIQDLLSMDNITSKEKTISLAKVCQNKTHGNVFFLLQFLIMLHENELLKYNLGMLSWTWNEEEIEQHEQASDNVVDLLKSKMSKLSSELLLVLKLGACLGSPIEFNTLRLVWEHSDVTTSSIYSTDRSVLTGMTNESTTKADDSTSTDLVQALEELCNVGFIMKSQQEPEQQRRRLLSKQELQSASATSANSATIASTAHHLWVHDKIHEAAWEMIPKLERNHFCRHVGETLLHQFNEKELDSSIFIVVDLLNEADHWTNEDDRLKLSRLNYRACQTAMSSSAFESAAAYAGNGIALLPSDAWSKQYDLTLKLYTTAVKAAGFLHNVEKMEEYSQIVLSQDSSPVRDKVAIYVAQSDMLFHHNRLPESIELLLEILKKLGHRFPKNSVVVGIQCLAFLMRLKFVLSNLQSLKDHIMEDEDKILELKLLFNLGTSMFSDQDDRVLLVFNRALGLAVKHGISEVVPRMVEVVAMISAGFLNDFELATAFADLATKLTSLLARAGISGRNPGCVLNILVYPFTKPMGGLLKPLLENYDTGLNQGDLTWASYAIFYWLYFKWMLGNPLARLEADMNLYSMQMRTLKSNTTFQAMRAHRQVMLNLLGRDNMDNPTHMSGQSVSQEDLEEYLKDKFNGKFITSLSGMLRTYYGEYVQQADALVELGIRYFFNAFPGMPELMIDAYLNGIACFVAAQLTGKRIHARNARFFLSKIKLWHDKGCPNVRHYYTFMQAEAMVLKRNNDKASKLYKETILVAARGGYQQDAALANERLGDLHLKLNDQEEANYRFKEAIKYWRAWGAYAKVESLERKHSCILRQSISFLEAQSGSVAGFGRSSLTLGP